MTVEKARNTLGDFSRQTRGSLKISYEQSVSHDEQRLDRAFDVIFEKCFVSLPTHVSQIIMNSACSFVSLMSLNPCKLSYPLLS